METTGSSSTPPGVWQWDIRQNLVEVDDAARALLGEPLDGSCIRFESLCRPVVTEDLLEFRAALQELVLGGCRELDLGYRIQTRWGQVRWVRMRAQVLELGDGGAVLRVGGSLVATTASGAGPAPA